MSLAFSRAYTTYPLQQLPTCRPLSINFAPTIRTLERSPKRGVLVSWRWTRLPSPTS